MIENNTVGPIYVEVTFTVRLYAKSQAHAILEVENRVVKNQDANALSVMKCDSKVVKVS